MSSNTWTIEASKNITFGQLNFDFKNKHKVLVLGLGSKPLSKFQVRKLIHKAVRFLQSQDAELLSTNLAKATGLNPDFILLSLLEANYTFDLFKSHKVSTLNLKPLLTEVSKKSKILVLAEAIKLAKDLTNAPPNLLTPAILAEKVQSIFKQSKNVSVKVLDEKQCAKENLHAFLAVGQASINKPRLIEINYTPTKLSKSSKKTKVALIGKGLTYDTGGLCLKPSNYMNGMQSDMGGAAIVIATIKAASELNLPVPITSLVLACENSFGDNSYRPGDVLNSLSGKTIEVVDTDAEGRITLADALTFISKRADVQTIIDYATLTGSCASALGEVASGAFGNNAKLIKDFSLSADEAGEPVWELPMPEEEREQLESSIADIAQCAGRPDASLAALFLKEFIVGEQDWLHLDVAGTAYLDKENEYFVKGATGRSIWSTINYLEKL